VKVICGLVWPELGYPAFACIIKEQSEISGYDSVSNLIISDEIEAPTIPDLTKKMEKMKFMRIYADNDQKYFNYIKEFSKFKREKGFPLSATKSMSIEASMLKVREYIKDKKITFPDNSIVRRQLASFSRQSLKDNLEFNGVRALANAIWGFEKRKEEIITVPKIQGWW